MSVWSPPDRLDRVTFPVIVVLAEPSKLYFISWAALVMLKSSAMSAEFKVAFLAGDSMWITHSRLLPFHGAMSGYGSTMSTPDVTIT
jgi:hypothetical protein